MNSQAYLSNDKFHFQSWRIHWELLWKGPNEKKGKGNKYNQNKTIKQNFIKKSNATD